MDTEKQLVCNTKLIYIVIVSSLNYRVVRFLYLAIVYWTSLLGECVFILYAIAIKIVLYQV